MAARGSSGRRTEPRERKDSRRARGDDDAERPRRRGPFDGTGSGEGEPPRSRRSAAEPDDDDDHPPASGGATSGFDEADLLPRLGGGRSPGERDARAILGELRDLCGRCRYRRICGFAPVQYQIERGRDEKAKHRHHDVLEEGVRRLEQVPGWDKALLAIMAEREKDALLAGCLLATAWRKKPERLARLVEYTAKRCDVERLKEEAQEQSEAGLQPGQGIDPEKIRARMFRGQVLRTIAFAREESAIKKIRDLLVLAPDDEGRLFQYEAVAALAYLVGVKRPGGKWIEELESAALGPFRATFGARHPGGDAIDLFFPYRRGKRRSYLYFRRDREGKESVSSVDKIRIDSLLSRIFRVFDTDERKTWRVFKELCRHLNVRAGKMNADQVLEGFDKLPRDDLLLLGMYAPALARAVGHFTGVADYHHLVKLLYKLRGESGRRGGPRVAAWEKVVDAREEWAALAGALGADFVREVFALLFRLNASYTRRVYTTDTYIKIGEVAYLLTAIAGWNPKGLDQEIKKTRKPLALIAYGLQPPDKWSSLRVKKLARAKERVADKHDLVRAVEVGMKLMARFHGYESWQELQAADERGDLEEGKPPRPPIGPQARGPSQDFEIESQASRSSGEGLRGIRNIGGPSDEGPVDEDASKETPRGRPPLKRPLRRQSDVGSVDDED